MYPRSGVLKSSLIILEMRGGNSVVKLQCPAGEDALPEDLCDYWERFLKNPDEVKNYICWGIFNDPLLFPLQRPKEMRRMLEIADSYQPKVVFEIGADKGGGLYHWCCLPTVQRVIGCEIRGTPYASLFQERFPQIDFLWLPSSSYDPAIVAKVKEWLGADSIDAMFIDGDKSNFDTDFYAYVDCMGHPSVVFMHDIQDRPPTESYHKFLKATHFKHEEIIDITESEWAVGRERAGMPPATVHEQWLRHWHGRSCGVGVIRLE